MPKVRLHLDADISSEALCKALIARGHDVTRTPNPWMPQNANDMAQLLGATAQGRCILTLNVRDFSLLARNYSQHYGIILAKQEAWSLSMLIAALDRLLREEDAENLVGQVRWLSDWRV